MPGQNVPAIALHRSKKPSLRPYKNSYKTMMACLFCLKMRLIISFLEKRKTPDDIHPLMAVNAFVCFVCF